MHRVQPTPAMRPAGATLGDVFRLLQYQGYCSARTDVPEFQRRRVRVGEPVFRMGQAFCGLYLVRFGMLKTVLMQSDGSEQVISFSIQGDLLGAEGPSRKSYRCETFALTDCEVIHLPAEAYFSHGRTGDGIERMLYWAISREVCRRQVCIGVLRAAKSEARVARFLTELAEHHAAQGLSPCKLHLPMTRLEIGSYLGLAIGTVSRAFSALNALQIIDVCNRDITIKDMQALTQYEGSGGAGAAR